MKGYLGEFPVDLAGTEMAGYTLADWALQRIEKYGQIDGEHHKTWVLDQVASILLGTPVIVTEARWESGCTERRMRLGIPSAKYDDWVAGMRGEELDAGEFEYEYDHGVAP